MSPKDSTQATGHLDVLLQQKQESKSLTTAPLCFSHVLGKVDIHCFKSFLLAYVPFHSKILFCSLQSDCTLQRLRATMVKPGCQGHGHPMGFSLSQF